MRQFSTERSIIDYPKPNLASKQTHKNSNDPKNSSGTDLYNLFICAHSLIDGCLPFPPETKGRSQLPICYRDQSLVFLYVLVIVTVIKVFFNIS